MTSMHGRPVVIKVGGSLAESGRLAAVLGTIAQAKIPVVLVPGGGPFADAVRTIQRQLKFDDQLAHRLAMLAMEQMAEYIVSLQDGMKLVRTLEELSDAVMDGQIPVWAPLPMMSDDDAIASDWSATSDSLAARLAALLDSRLVLLKSISVPPDETADQLADRGVVDTFFPQCISRSGVAWAVLGPDDETAFHRLLGGEGTG
jgi:5-(aminomethyl)-3-furanmethanol phosphate kinase